jgi:hypothetical protein
MRIILLVGLIFVQIGTAFSSPKDEKHVEVSLRMIGHQILLSAGDSTSRVLPIVKKGGSYRVQFATAFGFNPDRLAVIIDSVVNATHLAKSYNVAFEMCGNKEVVHMYEVGATDQENVLACLSRDVPEGCYELVFTILDAPAVVTEANTSETMGENASSVQHLGHELLFVFLCLTIPAAGLLWFLRRRRRRVPQTDPNQIWIGTFLFNPVRMELSHNGKPVELTSKESDLLQLLSHSANDTVDRETILKTVWGDDGDYIGRTLDVFISKLRKKLEADPNVKIANIRGIGYKLIVDS